MTRSPRGTRVPPMAMHHTVRSLIGAVCAAGLVAIAPAIAGASTQDFVPACGGDKGKDVKKPKPDEDQDKRPQNPA